MSSSKGVCHVCDLRMNSDFERCAVKLEVQIDPSKRHFFTEIISSVSSCSFNPVKEHEVACRDYISVKIWDVRNPAKPLKQFNVTDYIDKKLCDLYESESVFDKFKMKYSPDGQKLLTGSYNGNGFVLDQETGFNSMVEAAFGNKRGKACSIDRQYKGRKISALPDSPAPDLKKKVQLVDWHPTENIIAMGNHNCIFIFNEEKNIKKDEK